MGQDEESVLGVNAVLLLDEVLDAHAAGEAEGWQSIAGRDAADPVFRRCSMSWKATGQYSAPNGKTFNQAFMETLRAFQLMAILPQYIDYGGDPEYFSEVLDSIFQQFIDKYATTNPTPEIVKQTQEIQQFLNNRHLTKKFVDTIGRIITNAWETMRLGRTCQ